MSSKKQLDALIETACESGKTVDSFGDFDTRSEVGHDVVLLHHGGLFVVIERKDDEDDNVESFTDEAEAREAFAEVKAELEEEEAE